MLSIRCLRFGGVGVYDSAYAQTAPTTAAPAKGTVRPAPLVGVVEAADPPDTGAPVASDWIAEVYASCERDGRPAVGSDIDDNDTDVVGTGAVLIMSEPVSISSSAITSDVVCTLDCACTPTRARTGSAPPRYSSPPRARMRMVERVMKKNRWRSSVL